MNRFIVGFVAGILVASVGVTGIARILDRSVEKVKEVATEQAK